MSALAIGNCEITSVGVLPVISPGADGAIRRRYRQSFFTTDDAVLRAAEIGAMVPGDRCRRRL
jgi:hypothetical protein